MDMTDLPSIHPYTVQYVRLVRYAIKINSLINWRRVYADSSALRARKRKRRRIRKENSGTWIRCDWIQ